VEPRFNEARIRIQRVKKRGGRGQEDVKSDGIHTILASVFIYYDSECRYGGRCTTYCLPIDGYAINEHVAVKLHRNL
jgi:hypothetical protein